jgi:hypothetical protein
LKVFIIFLALLVLNISFLCYWSDMDRYARMQNELKKLAEECASGAALFRDEEAYSCGSLSIDATAAEAYLTFVLEKMQARQPFSRSGAIAARMEIFDDVKGYAGAEACGIFGGGPAVMVELTWEGCDLFRLPLVCVETLKRSATYQWEGGLTSSLE